MTIIVNQEILAMFVKGIKRGKIIELLEEVDFPDNQEILVEIREINDFWSALQDFRKRVNLESIDDDTFEDLRDKSPGREVDL
ncbi:hypothetical protein [Planktothrix sp. FACHB-1365]|uniref:hypothetical protein n=1 Tax=Planktothrix sp. FACHB-1365 TaxID=2692855 RepID=UPI001F54AEE2|nr:hypothetical protein [Planktothrix sp. FACHB-1365]